MKYKIKYKVEFECLTGFVYEWGMEIWKAYKMLGAIVQSDMKIDEAKKQLTKYYMDWKKQYA